MGHIETKDRQWFAEKEMYSQPDTSTLAGRIAVEQAALAGTQLQSTPRTPFSSKPDASAKWRDCTMTPADRFFFNWHDYFYRVKPQEPLRCFVLYRDGMIWGVDDAEIRRDSYLNVPMVQLTPEIDACLKANGLI